MRQGWLPGDNAVAAARPQQTCNSDVRQCNTLRADAVATATSGSPADLQSAADRHSTNQNQPWARLYLHRLYTNVRLHHTRALLWLAISKQSRAFKADKACRFPPMQSLTCSISRQLPAGVNTSTTPHTWDSHVAARSCPGTKQMLLSAVGVKTEHQRARAGKGPCAAVYQCMMTQQQQHTSLLLAGASCCIYSNSMTPDTIHAVHVGP